MKMIKIIVLMIVVNILVVGQNKQEKTIEVTVSDPAPIAIEKLKQQADLVAYVKVLSGDSENFNSTLYKAKIIKAFKGCKKEQNIYFTPFIGYEVGSEYLVFLKSTNKTIEDIRLEDADETQVLFKGSDKLFQIMYGGYSVMPIKYTCVFEGISPSENCDYGVNLNVYQIPLPTNIKVFPLEDNEKRHSDSKWVRKDVMTNFLSSF